MNARVVLPRRRGFGRIDPVRLARARPRYAAAAGNDLVVDLDGAFVLPGLINAHDHLELNHYGRLKRRDRYENARDWIDDLRPALKSDPAIRENSAHPLTARLFIGGLKNLLAGVTTVAHHNPRYREIGARFPVRVVKRYGWAHSFSLERPAGRRPRRAGRRTCSQRCIATPTDVPFMMHVGEGVDAAAAAELPRLEALGCLRPQHGARARGGAHARTTGIASSIEARAWSGARRRTRFCSAAPLRSGCFSTRAIGAAAHVCLGSDSRVTGARDLLDELRAAAALMPIAARELFRMVTTAPARILHLHDAGRIAIGCPADLVVVPSSKRTRPTALLTTSRRDVTLVTIGGDPIVGAPSLRSAFAARRTADRHGHRRRCRSGLVSARLARAIARCPDRRAGRHVRSPT